MTNPVNRVEPVLAVYRELNGNTGNDFSHARDLILDLMYYIDNTNQGAEAWQLIDIVNDMYQEATHEEYLDISENP